MSNSTEPLPGRGSAPGFDGPGLVARARGGSRAAFARLVEAHQGAVYGLVLRLVGDPEHARDLAQETFLKAYTSLHTLHDVARFKPWLFAIAANQCRNWLRSQSRATAHTEPRDAGPDPREAPDPHPLASPALAADLRERQRRVQQAIAALPLVYREVAVLRFQAEMRVRDIAEALGLSVAAVESRLRRAKALLRTALAPLADEGERR